ncbi:MAG: hypothetical protein KGS61_14220 [Verrucomicrobia bacterium]|nr:hypothetical protein [Verrucomicrobiota bacterium]
MKRIGFGAVIAAVLAIAIPLAVVKHPEASRGRFTPQIAVGDGHTLALTSTGRLYGWDRNDFGQLGNGGPLGGSFAFFGTPRPRLVSSNAVGRWIKLAAGDNHTLAIAVDGSLWAWGRNDYGQLGNGILTDRRWPIRIGHDTDWAAVAGGMLFSIALKRDGTLWGWGLDCIGQVGLGTESRLRSFVGPWDSTNRVTVPTQVGRDSDWVAIAAGGEHALALKTDGSLWGWGRNDLGQIGDGTFEHRNHPVRIGSDHDWAAVAAGGGQFGGHSAALKRDGSLWVWGNWQGRYTVQAGPPGVPARPPPAWVSRPMRIGADRDWMRVAAGDTYTVALKGDGTIWGVGADTTGQLPVSRTTSTADSTLIRVAEGRWVDIATSSVGLNEHYDSYGLSADGTLWAWSASPAFGRQESDWEMRIRYWCGKAGIKIWKVWPPRRHVPVKVLSLGIGPERPPAPQQAYAGWIGF